MAGARCPSGSARQIGVGPRRPASKPVAPNTPRAPHLALPQLAEGTSVLIPSLAPAAGRARPRRSRGLKTVIAFATTVLALATTIATAPGASAALTAVGPVDPTTNFPSWYQDANGR